MCLAIISVQYYCAPNLLFYTSKIVVACILNIFLQLHPTLLIGINITFYSKPKNGIPGDTSKVIYR